MKRQKERKKKRKKDKKKERERETGSNQKIEHWEKIKGSQAKQRIKEDEWKKGGVNSVQEIRASED